MATFVSVVGTQVMGTLNPLLALLDEQIKIDKVLLLYTNKSKEYAERLVPWIKEYYPNIKIETGLTNLTIDVEALLSQTGAKEIIYNISGGLNFQIAKFLYDYYLKRGRLDINAVYSEMESTWLYNLETGDKQKLNLKKNLNPLELLDLQKVTYELTQLDKKEKFIELYFGEEKLTPLYIDGVKFHHIITKKNYLYFFRIESKYNLPKIREVISTIKDRSTISELKSFKVIIATNDSLVEMRYKLEGEGIFEVYPYKEIHEIIKTPFSKNVISKTTTKQHDNPSKNPSTGKTLYTILSRDILVTLKTIFTHKCENLCLMCTEENEILDIACYKRSNISRWKRQDTHFVARYSHDTRTEI